jgi:8-oxo-dGTP pyrophosphatase MutT (NUDIX family)
MSGSSNGPSHLAAGVRLRPKAAFCGGIVWPRAETVLVGAILISDHRVLLCHRSHDRAWFPDVWDLPGGHVQLSESAAEALARELEEELGIQIDPPM